MIYNIIENLSIMVLTIVAVLVGFYLVLKWLDWGLRRKSGGREQAGLSALWISSQIKQPPAVPTADASQVAEPPGEPLP